MITQRKRNVYVVVDAATGEVVARTFSAEGIARFWTPGTYWGVGRDFADAVLYARSYCGGDKDGSLDYPAQSRGTDFRG